ncbi:MAG: FAD-binding oxidoreductase, partial [Pirellulales bacterium]|nr:FAD-binding oxidoreductase [Pirellulales bacterium]
MPDALILALGVAAVSLVLMRLAILVADSLRRLIHQRHQDQLQLEWLCARITEAQDQHSENVLAWNGFRKFEIAKRVEEAQGICSFYLKPHDGKPLPSFKAGQYLTFRLNIPGREKPVIRCYSLSDRPRHDLYRVTVKRVKAPRQAPGAPPGLVSNYFHEQLQEGDIVDAQ